ncbi:unnamed protein product [Cochlearia groenlandica]
MIGGYGMKKHIVRFTKPQECSFCNQIFSTPQDLITHVDYFHSNHHSSTVSSSASTTFRHYQKLNRNPNPAFPPVRKHFDLNFYRSGYLDTQGRFHKGLPPVAPAITPARKFNSLFGVQEKKPTLIDLFPDTSSSEDTRTLPLLCQLDQRRPVATATANGGGAISRSIDLTLRL